MSAREYGTPRRSPATRIASVTLLGAFTAALLSAGPVQAQSPWGDHAANAQHTGLSPSTAQALNEIVWTRSMARLSAAGTTYSFTTGRGAAARATRSSFP
jgi:hypothetical protein